MTTETPNPERIDDGCAPEHGTRVPGLFRSFWLAGFEGAGHVNGSARPLDLNQANGHWERLDTDYASLAPLGIRTVRESIGWRLTERNDGFDWRRLDRHAHTARRHGLQVIWTLMYYGWPAEMNPFEPRFVSRFARYCEHVARRLRSQSDEPPFYQPLNENSFLSWTICDTGLIHPFDGSLGTRGFELKCRLVRAALAGSEAIWSVDPRARIIHTDPLVHVAAPEEHNRSLDRVLCEPYAERLRYWQAQHPHPARSANGAQRIPSPRFPARFFVSEGSPMSTIVVFSHLRWNFVFQRPQHLLSRLADHHRIVFVEEPVYDMQDKKGGYLERLTPRADVEVLRPHVTTDVPGFHDDHLPALRRMLTEFLSQHGIDDYIVWFYTPMALPLLRDLTPRGVVYDCMDELTAFKNAPRQLVQRENALLKVADLVFTGGPSLYESKRGRHASVHCFPSSVDANHFAPKTELGQQDHPAQRAIAHPRLGYCGVIDERIDVALIDALASTHPEWQLVMVGPIVKIDPAQLPKYPNIHWLGQRSYAELPQLMAGWDVCLLPFALNEATRFISPTKTLEYMAAERPVVSTPIKDVAAPYAHVVRIASSHAEFIDACAAALAESDAERTRRIHATRAIVARTSWNDTTRRMASLINHLPARLRTEAADAVLPPVPARGAPSTAPSYDTIVLGAGPTGLSAAYHLGQGSLLLERQATVGGWCRSIVDNGFTFDYAGHIMFSADPYVLALYERLLGDNLHWQNREAWVYSKDVYTRYPFQGALYGLPPKVLKECLIGAIEARFGPLNNKDRRAVASGATPSGAGALVTEARAPRNFEEFIYKVWGAGVAKHFAIPYNRKLWAVPLTEMETSWLGGRVPLPDLEEMIEGALEPVGKPMGPNARFGYPLRGGFQALMNGFLPLLEGEMQLNAEVVSISAARRTVVLANGRSYRFETLISTLPLPKLVEALGDEAPEAIQAAARALRHVSVRCVNLGIGREAITEKHWIYYPEDTVFHRIFVQGNASPYCNPPGGFGLTCEITYSEYKPLPCDGRELIQRCIDDCVRVGMIRADDPILAANQVDMPYAYVVYDHARAQHVETIRKWLAEANILLAGRYSEWEYYNSDHAFVAGKKAAERALELNAQADHGERGAARLNVARA